MPVVAAAAVAESRRCLDTLPPSAVASCPTLVLRRFAPLLAFFFFFFFLPLLRWLISMAEVGGVSVPAVLLVRVVAEEEEDGVSWTSVEAADDLGKGAMRLRFPVMEEEEGDAPSLVNAWGDGARAMDNDDGAASGAVLDADIVFF